MDRCPILGSFPQSRLQFEFLGCLFGVKLETLTKKNCRNYHPSSHPSHPSQPATLFGGGAGGQNGADRLRRGEWRPGQNITARVPSSSSIFARRHWMQQMPLATNIDRPVLECAVHEAISCFSFSVFLLWTPPSLDVPSVSSCIQGRRSPRELNRQPSSTTADPLLFAVASGPERMCV